MKTKLTLSVDREAVVMAKRLARHEGVSVSALFEHWSVLMAGRPHQESLGKRLRGRWQSDSVSEDPRMEYLLAKHAGQ